MKILCIGDVVSSEGVEYLVNKLPRLRRETGADVVIVNGENSAVYNGIDKRAYDMILSAGADVVTGGNHSFQKRTAVQLHDEEKRLIRPGNVKEFSAGQDEIVLDMGRRSVRVINVSGSLYMKEECENPFEYMERKVSRETDIITVVDFHAEATSEKKAMGYFLDGKVSLVVGTHTHVQKNDAIVLEGGTGYITDLGMVGVKHSVLGKGITECIHNFRYPDNRMKITDGKGQCILSGIIAEIDDNTKKCVSIEVINIDN